MRVLLFSEKDTGLREAEPAEDARSVWTKAVSKSCPSSQASLLQSQHRFPAWPQLWHCRDDTTEFSSQMPLTSFREAWTFRGAWFQMTPLWPAKEPELGSDFTR